MPEGVGPLSRESSALAVGFEKQECFQKRRPGVVFMAYLQLIVTSVGSLDTRLHENDVFRVAFTVWPENRNR